MKCAIRSLLRDKGFTAIAIATLAFGIGANTAIFSVIDSILLKPLAYREPDRLYLGRMLAPALAHIATDFPVNARHFHEWRTACKSCEQIALVGGLGVSLTGAGEPERLPGLQVSSNFLKVFGAQPLIGRDFLPAEELPGASRVVILSAALWRRRFGGDPSIIGRTITLDGQPNQVVGILPSDLNLPKGEEWGALFPHNLAPLILRPLGFNASEGRATGNYNYASVIRLAPGATPQRAIAEMTASIAQFMTPSALKVAPTLVPLEEQVTKRASASLWTVFGAVAAVLLIVCVNLGNLMLVRAFSRQREAAIRMALGATRANIFKHVLTEAFILASAGGLIGLLVAYAGLRIYVSNAPVELPRLQEIGMDWRVFGFAFAISAFSGALCGLVPAWRLSNSQPQESLKAVSGQTTASKRSLHLREALVAVEVALSAALLIVGGLLGVSFYRLLRVEKGFAVHHVITQDISMASQRYKDKVSRNRFIDEALRKVGEIPGVRSVAITSYLPLRGETWIDAIWDAAKVFDPNTPDTANLRFVSPGYWKTMGIGLKQGRYLEETDRDRRVTVIGERTARHFWPGDTALGKQLKTGPKDPPLEVIGVVSDVRTGGLDKDSPMMLYQHYSKIGPAGPSFVLSASVDPALIYPQIRALFASLDPELPLLPPRTVQQIVDESVAPRRFQTSLAIAFAISALLLASLGLYGVISFSVARRTHELGIRLALGAQPARILAMVVRQGLAPVVIGLAAGIALALVAGRVIAGQLYGVTAHDPWTITAVALLLGAVSAIACWIPARRAAKVDPLNALRFE